MSESQISFAYAKVDDRIAICPCLSFLVAYTGCVYLGFACSWGARVLLPAHLSGREITRAE
jgi:hypothetical protein